MHTLGASGRSAPYTVHSASPTRLPACLPRPQVGLLSRRIVIQGAAGDSEPTDTAQVACWNAATYGSYPCPTHLTGYGGHIIFNGTGSGVRTAGGGAGGVLGRLSGVELYRMGQTNFEGRYPVHWHQIGDGTGSYIEDSSVHHSFYKVGIVPHVAFALLFLLFLS